MPRPLPDAHQFTIETLMADLQPSTLPNGGSTLRGVRGWGGELADWQVDVAVGGGGGLVTPE
jgi:hypothetical protein